MNVMSSSSILYKLENTKPLYSTLSLVGHVESQGNEKLCFLHGIPRTERNEACLQGKQQTWTEKLSSKDCSEVSSINLNGVSTLGEKQYLAKQQTCKALSTKSNEYSRLCRITSLNGRTESDVINKISRIDSLPNFPTHGAKQRRTQLRYQRMLG